MAGVSSESLATALAALEGKLPTASLQLAKELFGILGMVDSSAGLRRALTDPSRNGDEKSALVRQLVGGKVSADAADIAGGLASSRWASARDIGDALETLAATVVISVAENKSAVSASGITGLEELENDLFSFNQAVASNHEVQRALSEPQASAAAKAALAEKLVPGVSEEAKVLITQAVSQPRGIKPTRLVERFAELAAKRQQRWIATVSVTRPLSQTQQARLQAGLNALYGRELKINVNVDPALIGGIRVQVGDEVLDASVMTRLGELQRQLAG
ncbi:F0F1 ATP synthase subunit delta [Pseudarthrobacter enclensis]|jgi:F-type H+-transporting ATPase subunit delta|uniref:ATP synthase subunit delta n=1 Tax=Pseudarthrobacter enclensis TaxID=993070 RepID=A0A0V8IWW1_9MICC|nr:F0F1 ATP synthase subunit delta [Pseudarthrobacter enclensis]KSU79191.1 ATP synthase subunit delta [Pseudarthrobacter enclensis]MBT2250023.1 F0F1 ATP synthase subunit delta [Arthrobacter sp. BHU FT2]BCW19613.1 ATP synthase subunit delta [Arthrobacter sp. NtRootA9]SCB84158.1 F-type H+-transporting ATPase subunit delta [Pseudarthrobacter enclensis]